LHGELDVIDSIVECHEVGSQGSTTNYANPSKRHLWDRERVLDESGAYQRMRASAGSSYWQGRIVRAYLTSVIWNIQRGKVVYGSQSGLACHGWLSPIVRSMSFGQVLGRSSETSSMPSLCKRA
jgi:hypothetical protein